MVSSCMNRVGKICMVIAVGVLCQASRSMAEEWIPRPIGQGDVGPRQESGVDMPAPTDSRSTLTIVGWESLLSNNIAAATVTQQSTSPPRQPDPDSPKWLSDLPYRPLPNLGNWPILPSGPGYYSLLDQVNGTCRPYMPRSAYPPYALMRNSMFDADWRYMDDPDFVSEDFFDRFHNVHLGDNWLFNTGGQLDTRYMGQYNSRLSGKTDDFDLLRIRPYVDFWYQDIFRIYAEMIFATSTPQSQTPLKTDVDAIDFLNLFIGVKLCEIDDHGVFLALAGRNSWSARSDWSHRSSGATHGKPFKVRTCSGRMAPTTSTAGGPCR